MGALDSNYARDKMILQYYTTPQEIAHLIVFLASPANSFRISATADVNGGYKLR